MLLESHIYPYLETPNPDHMLLIEAPPGFGKTHVMAKVASELANEGKRVFWAGVRHALYFDVLQEVDKIGASRAQWMEWLPHQDETLSGGITTCIYPKDAIKWMQRGNPLFEFCKNLCGIPYMQNDCLYYEQARHPKPIVYGHHNHVFLGNTLLANNKFDLLIGDENPISSVLRRWHIPAKNIIPDNLNPLHPLYHLCRAVASCVEQKRDLSGAVLVEALGGRKAVVGACRAFREFDSRRKYITPFRNPQDAPQHYDYFSELVMLLERECDGILDEGENYISRVSIHNDTIEGWGLLLKSRRNPSPALPAHVIWCDATPKKLIYEQVFKRKVEVVRLDAPRIGKIYQVSNSLNNISSLFRRDANGERTPHPSFVTLSDFVHKLVEEKGYERWAVATYKDGEDLFETPYTMHFGGNRGTNQWRNGEGAPQAVFVVGAPMPPVVEIEDMAGMIWEKRVNKFDATWSKVDKKSNFWNDPILADLTWLLRESEIIQTVHRSGVNIREVDVYLLTNLPIDELPPDETVTWKDALNVPDGIAPAQWLKVCDWADEIKAEQGVVTIEAFMQRGVSRNSANKYVDALIERGWYPVSKTNTDRRIGAMLEWDVPNGLTIGEWCDLWQIKARTPAKVARRMGVSQLVAQHYINAIENASP